MLLFLLVIPRRCPSLDQSRHPPAYEHAMISSVFLPPTHVVLSGPVGGWVGEPRDGARIASDCFTLKSVEVNGGSSRLSREKAQLLRSRLRRTFCRAKNS